MKKLLLVVTSLFSVSMAFGAVKKTEVYRVVGISAVDAGWTTLATAAGSSIYVNCAERKFDDAAHDRVASFDTVSECTSFLGEIRKNASRTNPAEVSISNAPTIELKVSL